MISQNKQKIRGKHPDGGNSFSSVLAKSPRPSATDFQAANDLCWQAVREFQIYSAGSLCIEKQNSLLGCDYCLDSAASNPTAPCSGEGKLVMCSMAVG